MGNLLGDPMDVELGLDGRREPSVLELARLGRLRLAAAISPAL